MTRTCFVHANLLDGEHPAKPNSTVVVEDDRIVTVTTGDVAPEPGDAVIDCAGRTLMPGMTSGHWHPTYRSPVGMGVRPVPLGYERTPAMHAYVAAEAAAMAVQWGITSVVGANCPFDIEPSLRDAIQLGMLPGPRVVPGSRDVITTADSTDTVPWWWDSNIPGNLRICNGADQFRAGVREEVKRGAEVIKLFPTGGRGIKLFADQSNLTQAELEAAVETAHGLGARVRCHVGSKAGIIRCLEAGVDIIDHGDGLDDECIQGLVETGTFLLPSIHAFLLYRDEYGMADSTNPTISQGLDYIRRLVEVLPAAVEAGVIMCLGDDYGTAGVYHGTYGKEPTTYVHKAGIPALEVIRWATVNGGLLVGRDDLGRIQEGYVADLVVVDGDPSVDITVLGSVENVHIVMRDGQIQVNDGQVILRNPC